MFRLALLAVATGSVVAAPVPKDFKPDDAKALVGKWHVESVHNDDKLYPSYPKNVFFEFDGNGQFVQTATGERNVYQRAYALDPSATPKRMTMLEPGAVAPQKWVFRIHGDELVMGYLKSDVMSDAALRPMPGVVLYSLKRVKDEK